MTLKLGKRAATYDRRDLLFSDFKLAVSATPAAAYKEAPVGFGAKHEALIANWEMLGNGPDDTVAPGFQGAGDCVLADAGHATMYANAMAGKTVLVTGKEAIADYSAITGYVVGDDSTDQGTDMRTALNFRRQTGTLAHDGSRHKIGGYCALEAGNFTELLEALAVFDVVSIGIEFPQSAMDQFDAGKPWTYVKSSPIEGGHDVLVVGMPGTLQGSAVTWAKVQPFASTFYSHLNDESFGVFLPESMVAGKSPEGFDLAQFTAALKAL
jgi:hypothetical protein